MHVVPLLVAHSQSAGLMQPCRGSLHHPTLHARPAAVPGAPLGGHRPDAARTQPLAVWTTGVHGDSATLRLHATLSGGASRSYPARIPSPWATSPRGGRSWARKGCRSVPSVRRCAGGRDTGTARASGAAEGAGSSSIAVAHQWLRHRPLLSPVANAAPVRRNQRLGEKVDALPYARQLFLLEFLS